MALQGPPLYRAWSRLPVQTGTGSPHEDSIGAPSGAELAPNAHAQALAPSTQARDCI